MKSTAMIAGCGGGWSSRSGHMCSRSGAPRRLWAWVVGQGPVQVPAKDLATAEPVEGWQRLSAGAGSKGERWYDWARWRLYRLQEQPWDHWLLVRRKISRPEELAYYVVFGPADTSLQTLAQVAGQRWRIEECFEAAKQEVGLADYEVRSWHGWYRHITLSMLAFAFLAVMRVKINAEKGAPDLMHFFQGSSWDSGCWIWCQATRAPTKAPRRAFPLLRALWTN